MANKKIIYFAAAIITLVSVAAFTGCQRQDTLKADWPYYASAEEIVEAADVIVTGEVLSAGEARNLSVFGSDKAPLPYTVSRVKVNEVIKGNISAGEIIEIKQLGDSKNNPEETLKEMDGYYKKGTEQLLFLCEYADSPYSPVCPAQGSVEIRDGKLYSNSRYSLFGFNAHESLDSVIEELSNTVK